jgi:hypothetical protein
VVPGSHELGRDALGDQPGGVPLGHQTAVRVGAHPGRAHHDPAHGLDAARHDDVVLAGGDAVRGEVHGLLAGSALAVDGRRGHVRGEAGAQPRHPARRRGLLAHLRDAADEHVVHRARVHLGAAAEQRLEGLGQQVDRVDVGQRAAGATSAGRRTYCVDDDDVPGVLRAPGAASCGRLRRCHVHCLS